MEVIIRWVVDYLLTSCPVWRGTLPRKEELQRSKDEILSYIHLYDKAMKEEIRNVNARYSGVIYKYPYPCKMLLRLVFPIFIRELHAHDKI
ncbi:MAG: hypothetical protein WAL66_12230 [Nitrososphaeraceae archaeon]